METKNKVEKYLKYCSGQKKLSTHTLKAYRIDLTQYIAFKDGISLSKNDLTPKS
ncbi:MAG: site-specific integrase [Clostridia bacterium]|nr:site-specific integrase [Clostridia bacterium]